MSLLTVQLTLSNTEVIYNNYTAQQYEQDYQHEKCR